MAATAESKGKNNGAIIRFEAKLWLTADKLRNNMDAELIDRQLEGWNLERMRAKDILDFNHWSVQLV